ncbi:MAG: hypothetical protein P8Z76_19755 [Alphaproteobacteria bacterium]
MRKLTLLGAAAAFALAANTAKADVFVAADVKLDKDIRVVELIAKVKLVALIAVIQARPQKAAESEALINQSNTNNKACENCAEKIDSIVDSLNGNSGITSVNQASGNMNNQGTVIAFSVANVFTDGDGDGNGPARGFAEAQAAGAQLQQFNTVETINVPFRDAIIRGSINRNSGVVTVNQAPGNLNNQANALSIAVARTLQGVALSEAVLGQKNANNNVTEMNTHKRAVIAGSIRNNSGIVAVNQAAGNMANQTNMVAIAATGH